MALEIGRKGSFALTTGALAAALLVPVHDGGHRRAWAQATAEPDGVAAALLEQEKRLAEQERRLNEQLRKLEAQQQALAVQQEQMNAMRQALAAALGQAKESAQAPAAQQPATRQPAAQQPVAQRPAVTEAPTQAATEAAKAGKAPGRMETAVLSVQQRRQLEAQQQQDEQGTSSQSRQKAPDVEVIADIGGVLTPKGVLEAESSFEYVHNASNRFVFNGAEIVDAVLVGAIEASDTDRDVITTASTFRYGVTDRFEINTKIPFVYRYDRFNTQIVGDGGSGIDSRSYDGYGLGDIEFGASYQLTGLPPFLVGNLRVKSDSGKGPFDVDRDAAGFEEEAPTGAGFWSVEPSVTAIYPSDPAVIFANLGYVANLGTSVDTQVGASKITNFDPGDSIKGLLGMGFSLNEQASVSLGYEHNYILESETEFTDDDDNKITSRANSLQVGNFFIGGSYRLSDRVSLVSTTQFGVTDDSPDVQFVMRMPVRLDLFSRGG